MKTKINIKTMVFCGLFAALVAVGAYIKIPTATVPITLQTMFATLAGLLLGAKRGAISVSVYVCIGLLGIPVFTKGGGISYVLQPSFGYIIGFIFAAFVAGIIVGKTPNPSFLRLSIATVSSIFVVYLFGFVYLHFILNVYMDKGIDIGVILKGYVIPFIPGDLIMGAIGVLLSKRLIPILSKMQVRD